MSTQSEVEAFFASGPPRDPERVNGRYKFTDPFGNEVSATSASNYGFPLADQFGLNKWKMRRLVAGIAQRPDLVAMLSVLDPDDVGKADEVISTALEVAGTSAKANMGTAIHEALRLADQGQPYADMFAPYVASYRAELQRLGLTVGMIETDVYSPGLGARGKLDRTFVEADGTHVLGDIKSTGHLELQAHEISVQMAVYQSATHYRDAQGAWHAIPRGKHPLRDDYAVIVHVDQEHASVTLYRLDLWIGKRGAVLAEQVRAWRKTGPVLLPYVPPGAPMPATGGEVQPAPPSDNVPAWSPAVSDAPSAPEPGQAMASAVAEGEIALAGETAPAQPPAGDMPPLRTATDLLRASVTKAQLQEYARKHGITDLAHTKKVLVEMLRKAGRIAPEGQAPAPAAPEVHPTRTPQFQQMTLSKIQRAESAGELQLINRDVVKQGGDAAWLPAYTEAARVRVAELDAAGQTEPHLTEVQACQDSAAIADLWDRVTVGGTQMGQWTAALQAAAEKRMAEINAATPPAPVNPFAGTK